MKHYSLVASLAHVFQIPMKPVLSSWQVARPLRQLQSFKQRISPFTTSATVLAKDKRQKIDQRISTSPYSLSPSFSLTPCTHPIINLKLRPPLTALLHSSHPLFSPTPAHTPSSPSLSPALPTPLDHPPRMATLSTQAPHHRAPRTPAPVSCNERRV